MYIRAPSTVSRQSSAARQNDTLAERLNYELISVHHSKINVEMNQLDT